MIFYDRLITLKCYVDLTRENDSSSFNIRKHPKHVSVVPHHLATLSLKDCLDFFKEEVKFPYEELEQVLNKIENPPGRFWKRRKIRREAIENFIELGSKLIKEVDKIYEEKYAPKEEEKEREETKPQLIDMAREFYAIKYESKDTLEKHGRNWGMYAPIYYRLKELAKRADDASLIEFDEIEDAFDLSYLEDEDAVDTVFEALAKLESKLKTAGKECGINIEDLEKMKPIERRAIVAIPVPTEKILGETQNLSHIIYTEKAGIIRVLPAMKKVAEYWLTTGDPEGYGSKLFALYELFAKEELTEDMNIGEAVKAKPKLRPYESDIRKLLHEMITYLEEEIEEKPSPRES